MDYSQRPSTCDDLMTRRPAPADLHRPSSQQPFYPVNRPDLYRPLSHPPGATTPHRAPDSSGGPQQGQDNVNNSNSDERGKKVSAATIIDAIIVQHIDGNNTTAQSEAPPRGTILSQIRDTDNVSVSTMIPQVNAASQTEVRFHIHFYFFTFERFD